MSALFHCETCDGWVQLDRLVGLLECGTEFPHPGLKEAFAAYCRERQVREHGHERRANQNCRERQANQHGHECRPVLHTPWISQLGVREVKRVTDMELQHAVDEYCDAGMAVDPASSYEEVCQFIQMYGAENLREHFLALLMIYQEQGATEYVVLRKTPVAPECLIDVVPFHVTEE